jgi:hypothetical protein
MVIAIFVENSQIPQVWLTCRQGQVDGVDAYCERHLY